MLDLGNESYKPFVKPNCNTKYVSTGSSHQPSILENIPEIINKRLNDISSCKSSFDEEKHNYQDALSRAGYSYQLNYVEKDLNFEGQGDTELVKKRRQRKVIWFNPPYAKNVKTNIGKKSKKLRFLILVAHR